MELDEDSFTDTAEAIWRFNRAAREAHPTPASLRQWMIEETNKVSDETQGWGTLGFHVSIARGNYARAAVDGWFVKRAFKTAEGPKP